MKKLFLLLAGGFAAFGAQAQYAKKPVVSDQGSARKQVTTPAHISRNTAVDHSTGRATSTACFATETFGSGTPTTLPTGWTAGIISGPGTWHWANTASTSTYSIGTIASTTASDGWMIFDSDSLGGAGSTLPASTPSGWLQSPAYDCSSYSSVRLTFQDYFRRFQDSCFVWVSTDPTFATYTSYPVYANNSIPTNNSTSNPDIIHINITAAAAGYSSVYIRFVYDGPNDGGYAWMIDDICLSPLNTDDVSISNSFMFQNEAASGAFPGSIFNTPLSCLPGTNPGVSTATDSLYPFTVLNNEGASAETNVPLTAQIWEGTTSVYNISTTYADLSGVASLSEYAVDSFVAFEPGFIPTSVGNYTCAFSAPLTTDGDMTNNYDTLTFAVTDTVWMENQGNITGGYYVRKGGTGGFAYFQGARFDLPISAIGDTVSGFGVVFDSQSQPTGSGTVSVQLYSANDATGAEWSFVGSSVSRSLTAADYSTSSSVVWAYFASDYVGSGNTWLPYILTPGTSYAAVIQVNGVSNDLVVDATGAPNANTNYAGYFGQSDTSENDGNTDFGHSSIATGFTAVPLVRMYLGNTYVANAVSNVNLVNQFGPAYPNPATAAAFVSYTLAQNSNIDVTLTNMLGQVVSTQHIANTVSGRITFNTANLPSGEYIYTLSANGQKSVGQIVVAH